MLFGSLNRRKTCSASPEKTPKVVGMMVNEPWDAASHVRLFVKCQKYNITFPTIQEQLWKHTTNLDRFDICLWRARPLLLQLCCRPRREAERKKPHLDNTATRWLLSPQCSDLMYSIFSWVSKLIHCPQTAALSNTVGNGSDCRFDGPLIDYDHRHGSCALAPDWNGAVDLLVPIPQLRIFCILKWWLNQEFCHEWLHVLKEDSVWIFWRWTSRISPCPVILRSCCPTQTFILRFRSLGNILCKLSPPFALEHFLCLLAFLWQYHTVKVNSYKVDRASPEGGKARKCTVHQDRRVQHMLISTVKVYTVSDSHPTSGHELVSPRFTPP